MVVVVVVVGVVSIVVWMVCSNCAGVVLSLNLGGKPEDIKAPKVRKCPSLSGMGGFSGRSL